MSVAAVRLHRFFQPLTAVLQWKQCQFYRLTQLCYMPKLKFSNVAFQADLVIDKKSLNKYVEGILLNSKTREEEINNLINKREKLLKNISSLDTLKADGENDNELKKLLVEECQQYLLEMEKLNLEILHHNYRKSYGHHLADNSTMMEISAGVGGQEAMLFANELFEMYRSYAANQGWEMDVIELDLSDIGGIRSSVACIRGAGVYQSLRSEGGVHRVQRIPVTDKNARLHTSTATVVIMPEPSEIDVEILEKDLKIETKRPSGPGGQNAQKSDSSVRITHLPTGIVSASQEHRTQSKNIRVAMTLLRTRLYAMNYGKQKADVDAVRRQQEGSRMRSEKIRTYNILQDRVTDHRWGTTCHNLPDIWSGGLTLQGLIRKCNEDYEEHMFKEYLLKLKTAPRK